MRLTALSLTAAAISAQAVAQDTDAQLAASRLAPLPSDPQAGRFVQTFGLCAAADVRNYSSAALRSYPGSDESHQGLFWVVMGSNSCARDKADFQFAPRSIRGPVAEYYLKRDFDLGTWSQKHRPVAIYPTPDADKLAKLPAEIRANVVLVEIGACVAQANPSATATLLGSQVGSADESAAFATLSPALAGCLSAGVPLKMSKFQLRGFLAEGAYRAAVAGQMSKAVSVPAAAPQERPN